VNAFFRAVGGAQRPESARIFTRSGPTEQVFTAWTVLFTGRNFPAGKAVFRARIGPAEQSLGLRVMLEVQ
jgi:hypothetical protein